MDLGFFTFNNKTSTDFGLMIADDIKLITPQTRGNFIEIEGSDGEFFLSDGKLKNARLSIPVYIEDDELINDVANWLKGDNQWHWLEYLMDEEFVYQAICTDEYSFSKTFTEFGKSVITFNLKPYKFLKSGLTERILDESITNPLGRSSKPKLTIKGSGNITINIGNSTLTLKNVDGGVIVDSLYQTVTTLNGQAQAWDKVTSYPLPTIAPGRQNVTTTGNVTEIKIIPRWEAIV